MQVEGMKCRQAVKKEEEEGKGKQVKRVEERNNKGK